MESLFFIGQKIVAIKDHSGKLFLKGQQFEVLDIENYCCGFAIMIFPFDGELKINVCRIHGDSLPTRGIYFCQSMFAPIQEIGDMTFEDAIEMVETKKETVLK